MSETTLQTAYSFCRQIARREAKNFYYAFLVLPRHKSDAMCAVYAFMRRADDIADDEAKTIEARRIEMAAWTLDWKQSYVPGRREEDPIFLALRDTQRRFNIPDELLEDLIRGTSMDLDESPEGVSTVQLASGESFQAFATFTGLYRYCYLVASVVGLVCIKIFGYTDARAEQLAEETGIAFQLTNILRDVTEDASRGRIYLPTEDMLAAHASFEEIFRAARGEGQSEAVRELLRHVGERAEAYYGAAERLLPLINSDGRAALWVMFTIYRELMLKIARKDYDVFAERVNVPTSRKLMILAQGFMMARRLRGNA